MDRYQRANQMMGETGYSKGIHPQSMELDRRPGGIIVGQWVHLMELRLSCFLVKETYRRPRGDSLPRHLVWLHPCCCNTRLSSLKTWRCGEQTLAPSLTLTHWRTTYSPLVFVGCLVVHPSPPPWSLTPLGPLTLGLVSAALLPLCFTFSCFCAGNAI